MLMKMAVNVRVIVNHQKHRKHSRKYSLRGRQNNKIYKSIDVIAIMTNNKNIYKNLTFIQ